MTSKEYSINNRGGHGMRTFVQPHVRPKGSSQATLLRLKPYLTVHNRVIISTIILVAFGAVATIASPWIIGKAIDAAQHGTFSTLFYWAVLLAAAYAITFISSWYQAFSLTSAAQKVTAELRTNLFEHLQKLPLRFFDTRSDGDTISRFSNDLENVGTAISQNFSQLISSALLAGGSLALMIYLNPLLSIAALAPVPFSLWATQKMANHTRKQFSAQQKSMGELNGLAEEMLGGLPVVQAFGKQVDAIEQFKKINTQLNKAGTSAQILSGIIPPFMGLTNNLSFALTTLAAGWLILHGHGTIGELTAFTLLTRQFSRPLTDIASQFNLIQAAAAGAERVFETMDETIEIGEKTVNHLSTNESDRIVGKVEFHQVDFSYNPEKLILRDISLTAEPGKMVALVGPTGSGKTTLINLLTRFYEVDSGSILVDGIDISTLERSELRKQLGVVLQDAHLFSTSIRDNLRYGNPHASEEEIRAAARLAHAEGFILRLPQGYDTIIAESGAELSQGERQLLTIARALLADPSILILDEATSNVDTRTEFQIQEAFRNLRKGRTCFVIAHRLSTIRSADLIAVLDQGRIVETGTHEELLELDGLYNRLYLSQFPTSN